MAESLAGVLEIEWASLRHAYGSAQQVPQWLAGLLDPATSDRALDDLDMSIYHQGGAVCTAAAAAMPFLIRLAAHDEVPGRAGIVDLLAKFARLSNEMREPWKSEPAALACRADLYGAYELFRVMLDDSDPAVRRAVAAVLVEFVDRADDVVEECRRRCTAGLNPSGWWSCSGSQHG